MIDRPRSFEIGPCLGRGGYGEVYRARTGSETVALKFLLKRRQKNAEALARLRDEWRILNLLEHSAIPRSHGMTVLDKRIALVTDYVPGTDTSRLGVLPLTVATAVASRVASALHHAYVIRDGGEQVQIVHRDVKPSNIRISTRGEVKLLDFGIASMDSPEREAETETGVLVGSLSYMSPERLTLGAAGPAADVYALGATLFTLLTGTKLVHGSFSEVYQLLGDRVAYRTHVERVLDGITTGSIPEDLLVLMRCMLAWQVAARPDAHQVTRRIAELELEGMPISEWAAANVQEAPGGKGSLTGRTLVENLSSRLLPNAVPLLKPRLRHDPTVLRIPLKLNGAPRAVPTSTPTPSRGPRLLAMGVGCTLFLAMACGLGTLSFALVWAAL